MNLNIQLMAGRITCYLILSFCLSAIDNCFAQTPAPGRAGALAGNNIIGYIRDSETEEALPFANVIIEDTKFGAATNSSGYFVIVNAPVGKCTLRISYIGFATQEIEIDNVPGDDKTITIEMERIVVELTGITVEGEAQTVDATENVSQVVMSPRGLYVLPNVG